jgi:hypothetical protein
MSADFGAELDAALNAHLASLHSAAQEARARVDGGIEKLAAAPRVPAAVPEAEEPAPLFFDEPPARHGAAVSFDLDEEFRNTAGGLAVDAEGIPMPEDNPPSL